MSRTRRRADVERMVDALLAGGALPAGRLEPDEAEALKAAIELRAGRPGADLPREEFLSSLRRRLAEETAPVPAAAARSSSSLSRRAVLAGAGGAVAAGVVGAVAERALRPSPRPAAAATGEIVPADGQWVAVASAQEVADGRVKRFATASTVGFVTERDDGTVSAVSGACTHQGCLLRLNEAAGRLDCPCHRTAFGVHGDVQFSQLATPPARLPTVQVRRRDGDIEAFLPREQ
jgi:Rieske Fe-S protein